MAATRTFRLPTKILSPEQNVWLHRETLYSLHSDPVAYNASSPVTIFFIPDNTIVWGCAIEITTAFAGTSPVLSVGISGFTARHMATTDNTATSLGWYGVLKGWNYSSGGYSSQGANVAILLTIGGSSLTAGVCRVHLLLRAMQHLQQDSW